MPTNACNEHGLVFPTPEKLDLHMNEVHYYPVGTRVNPANQNYRGKRGTVVNHNEHLGMAVEFDNGQHPEFFQARELYKLKNQTPFDPEAKPRISPTCVVHGLHFTTHEAARNHFEQEHASAVEQLRKQIHGEAKPSGEMTAMSHETEGFCFCGTTHKPDSNNAVYIERIQDEIKRVQKLMAKQRPLTGAYLQFLGKKQGLEHALLVLGVEIDE